LRQSNNKTDHVEGLDEAIAHLRRMAQIGNPTHKTEAVRRVASFGEPAIKPLIRVIESNTQLVPLLAGRALGEMGDLCVEELELALRSADDRLRGHISLVLRNINTYRSRKVLCNDIVENVGKRYTRRNRFREIALAVIGPVLLAAYMISIVTEHAFTYITPIMSVFMVWRMRELSRTISDTDYKRRNLQLILEGNDNFRIPLLALCIHEPDQKLRAAIRKALTQELPTLKVSDHARFSPETIQALLQALGDIDTPLILAILKALEQIGDERAVERVERLARTAKSREVRQAAEECLPALRASASNVRLANTLLRPAESPPDATLLRPAGAGGAETATLLRPVGGDDVETANTQHG